MAITFVLLKEIPNKKSTKMIYKTAKTWAEIENLAKQDFPPISRNLFNMINILESTKEYRESILKIRKRLHIPIGGYPVKQILNELLSHPSNIKTSEPLLPPKNDLLKYDVDYMDYANNRKYYLPHLDLAQQRLPIIYGNFVLTSFLLAEEPVVSLERQTTSYSTCNQITVKFQRQIRTEDIVKYFTKNAYKIQRLMQLLPPKNTFEISNRDLRIYQLHKEQGKRYPTIAEDIVKEFNIDDPENHINDNSVLQAFKKTDIKISNLLASLNLT